MRSISHLDADAKLPPPKPAPMGADEITDLVTMLFRAQGEVARQRDRFGAAWAAHASYAIENTIGLALAMLTVYEQPELFSVRADRLEVVQ
jgi:hypothetical protein